MKRIHFSFINYLLSIYYEHIPGIRNKGNTGGKCLIVQLTFSDGKEIDKATNDKASVCWSRSNQVVLKSPGAKGGSWEEIFPDRTGGIKEPVLQSS